MNWYRMRIVIVYVFLVVWAILLHRAGKVFEFNVGVALLCGLYLCTSFYSIFQEEEFESAPAKQIWDLTQVARALARLNKDSTSFDCRATNSEDGELSSYACILSKANSDNNLKMSDIFTKEKRSEIMSKIRSTGTKIELKMKAALEKAGIEFEYQPKIFGKPDFLIQPNVVLFCDSSFWHGRNWNKLKKQLSKRYWHDHIKRNIKRDKVVTKTLKQGGYVVLRFWDDEIKKEIGECIEKIEESMTGGG